MEPTEQQPEQSADAAAFTIVPRPEPPRAADYAIHGIVATFVEGHGWIAGDSLCAKTLNLATTDAHPDGATVEQAHAIVTREYSMARKIEAVDVVEPLAASDG